jgi:serine/threonine-protein kinase
MQRRVAIKVLPLDRVENQAYLDRFEQEARAAARLDHPNIVHAYDVENTGKTHYLVMEYVKGKDLHAFVNDTGPMDYELAADFILQAARGLAHAHEAGLVHRDIKPANLFLARGSDDTVSVKVLDFGIAKAAEDSGLAEQSGALTDTTEVMGSPRYMSPEQLEHTAGVDARADVWSLGVVLYELLSGRPPFDAPTIAALATAILTREPPGLSELNPDVPRGLSDVIALTLVKSRDSRIQSVAALARALTPFASQDTTSLVARIERIAAGKRGSLPPRTSQPPEPHAISTEGVAWRPSKTGGARATKVAALFVVALLTGGVLAELAFDRGAPAVIDARLGSSGALIAAEALRRIAPRPASALPPPATETPPGPSAQPARVPPHRPTPPKAAAAPPARPSSELHHDGLLDRK